MSLYTLAAQQRREETSGKRDSKMQAKKMKVTSERQWRRQTDRQTEWQTYWHINKQAIRDASRLIDRQTERYEGLLAN